MTALRRSCGLVALAAAALLAGGAAPTLGVAPGAGWGPTQKLAENVGFDGLGAAMNLREDAVVAWTDSRARAFVRTRLGARGRWRPRRLLGAGEVRAVALDERGCGAVVWRSGSRLRSARIGRDNRVSRRRVIASVPGPSAVVGLSLARAGRALTVVRLDDGSFRALAQPRADRPWAQVGADLTVPADARWSAAMNRAGDVLVAWILPGAATSVAAAWRSASTEAWEQVATLAGDLPAGASVAAPQVALGEDGSGAVTWRVGTPPSSLLETDGRAAFLPAGGSVADWASVPAPGTRTALGIAPSAHAMIAYSDDAARMLVASRLAPVDGTWPVEPAAVAEVEPAWADGGAIYLNPIATQAGPVLLQWGEETGPGPDVVRGVARDRVGAPWGRPRVLGGSRADALVRAGRRAALVVVADTDSDVIQATTYDRLARVSGLRARHRNGRMVVRMRISRPARMIGTVRSVGTGRVVRVKRRTFRREGLRRATLARVPRGRYELRLRFCNADGCAPVNRRVSV